MLKLLDNLIAKNLRNNRNLTSSYRTSGERSQSIISTHAIRLYGDVHIVINNTELLTICVKDSHCQLSGDFP